MASLGGIWVPMAQRILRQAVAAGARASQALRSKATAAARGELEPIAVRSSYRDQPVHPVALRRQAASGHFKRWFSSVSTSRATQRFFAASARQRAAGRASAPRYTDRVAFLKSPVATQAVWKSAGRSPFASTLRPNLTAGAFPRTAGGYSFGTGARYFSHTPTAPAQVVQNVSQAMRAFLVGGHRARFDGTDHRGRACYKAISALEEDVSRKMAVPALPALAPGAFVDFPLNPTITALAAANGSFGFGATAANHASTLHTEGFLDVLSVDFARALKEYSAVMNDLKRLAALGDLPVSLHVADGSGMPAAATTALRVRFPGVDADTVDCLCDDLGITRGVVGQDPELDQIAADYAALRFPYAPDDSSSAAVVPHALTSPGGSERSRDSSALVSTAFSPTTEALLVSYDDGDADAGASEDACYFVAAPPQPKSASDSSRMWLSVDASSLRSGAEDGCVSLDELAPVPARSIGGSVNPSAGDFEGLEGIYRFLEECDRVQARA